MTKHNFGVQNTTNKDFSIENASETAYLMAYFRGKESRRHDALFCDPYAELLAGGRGEYLAKSSPYDKHGSLSVSVRTCILDEIILRLIKEYEVDTVLNLGAGLDTRPYRLNLPAIFRWIEVDLPDILVYKEEKLAGVKPVCELYTVRTDLSNDSAAKSLFSEVGLGNKKVLVLSESLLTSLSEENVRTLAESLHQQTNFAWWLMDLMTPALSRLIFQSKVDDVSRFHFEPEEGPAFFATLGWEVAEIRSMVKEAHRLQRETTAAWLSQLLMALVPIPKKKLYRKFDSYVVLLARV
ncbi:class I SAM-dependent methyltransferase [Heliobacterium mobile]|nr:class I SAM-dependent methyltransferase [Heliobacterium mobile]